MVFHRNLFRFIFMSFPSHRGPHPVDIYWTSMILDEQNIILDAHNTPLTEKYCGGA